ncbi:hypothetical protein GEMRC1_013525 [Eukaryota sp. GEM-RC1]
MKVLIVVLAFLLCAQALKLPDSFTFIYRAEEFYPYVTVDVNQKLDGVGRARMSDTYGDVRSAAYIYKLGVTDGVLQSVFAHEGKMICMESEFTFPISNNYLSTLSLNGTIKYKDSEVDVWVNSKGISGASIFYVRDGIPVAFGDYLYEYHNMVDMLGFETRVFSRNHFIKPASVKCSPY